MDILANIEDPDEMPLNVAFQPGLQCMLYDKYNLKELKYIINYLKISIHGPLKYITNTPILFQCICKGKSISIQRVRGGVRVTYLYVVTSGY